LPEVRFVTVSVPTGGERADTLCPKSAIVEPDNSPRVGSKIEGRTVLRRCAIFGSSISSDAMSSGVRASTEGTKPVIGTAMFKEAGD
jgi:hypothetical protein